MSRRLRAELLLLVAGAAFTQLCFPFRHDLPAHVVGGGAVGAIAVALVSRRLVGRHGDLVLVVGIAFVTALSWLTEERIFGPFDLVDVVFTVAGAVLVADTASAMATDAPTVSERVQFVSANVALVGAALLYRYGVVS